MPTQRLRGGSGPVFPSAWWHWSPAGMAEAFAGAFTASARSPLPCPKLILDSNQAERTGQKLGCHWCWYRLQGQLGMLVGNYEWHLKGEWETVIHCILSYEKLGFKQSNHATRFKTNRRHFIVCC